MASGHLTASSAVHIQVPGEEKPQYALQTGVLQGDTLAPFLFVLLMDSVVHESTRDHLGIPLHPELPTSQKRTTMQLRPVDRGKTSLQTYTERYLTDLAFADDIVFLSMQISASESQLQCFEEFANKCGLYINVGQGKTEVLTFNTAWKTPQAADGTEISQVNYYKYLGTDAVDPMRNIRKRYGTAWVVIKKFDRLWKCVAVEKDTKTKFFVSLVESIFLYGIECVTLTQENLREIDSMHRKMLAYTSTRFESSFDTYDNGEIARMSSRCIYKQIMLVGHAYRHDSALARVLERTVRGLTHNTTWERQLKKHMGLPHEDWFLTAQNRLEWKNIALTAAERNEDRVVQRLAEERRRRWTDLPRLENRVFLLLLEYAPAFSWHPQPTCRLEMLSFPKQKNSFATGRKATI